MLAHLKIVKIVKIGKNVQIVKFDFIEAHMEVAQILKEERFDWHLHGSSRQWGVLLYCPLCPRTLLESVEYVG